jgi:mannosyl-glycoprotein endo-beta-N-acetylglucosaminidase
MSLQLITLASRYDAVTTEGKLAWQNTLTKLNSPYLDACDGLFLDYQ